MKDLVPRLGVNIDHIATLRQLRGTPYPDLLQAAKIVESAGADQITVHLREDRRHIQDEDVRVLRKRLEVSLNLEMAIADGIVRFAEKIRPEWACLVPERRQEVTTEGGLDLKKNFNKIAKVSERLKRKKIRLSLFIEPSVQAVELSARLGADAVEFHTGRYCLETRKKKPSAARLKSEKTRLRAAAERAAQLGILPHAGHGIDYENVRDLVEMTDAFGRSLLHEFNIGHAIVCRSAFVGLAQAVREMVGLVKAP